MGVIEDRLAKMGLTLPPVHPFIDGASDLFYELWGPDRGAHARAAVGVAELPRRSVLEIVGEFKLHDRKLAAKTPRTPRGKRAAGKPARGAQPRKR